MCERLCIDTNIWEYAHAHERGLASDLNAEANAFLKTLLSDDSRVIVISEYQMCEIQDVFRKMGLGAAFADLLQLFWSDKCRIASLSRSLIQEAIRLSQESGIHVYDYLVALPVRGLADVIYSADAHFSHPHFQAVAHVQNPISWVMHEGQQPQRRP